MRLRTALLSSTFLLLSLFTLAQTKIVEAQILPLTAPLTPPLTSTMKQISGKVTYRFLNRFFSFFAQKEPASGVTVEATNIKTKEKTMTQTNMSGDYSLSLKEGLYRVKVTDTNTVDIFMPSVRIVHLKRDKPLVNFQGLVLP